MLYLNEDSVRAIGFNWSDLVAIVKNAVSLLSKEDYSQPIKPYLRYGDAKNRIIAMPAYIGGSAPLAGIKWIASFPDNIHKGRKRAHSVTILNEHDSGMPICMINTAIVSAVRTAAVSGVLIDEYLNVRAGKQPLKVGINGFGPIGQMHLHMITELLKDRIDTIKIYDIKSIDADTIAAEVREKVTLVSSWEECYTDADIFITCTVSAAPYINLPPVKGSLQLNVSLRDYDAAMKNHMDVIVVDDWEEVCRQHTDIENMHKQQGLQQADALTIADIVCENALSRFGETATIMFNPMGMAIFDIAVGGYYYQEALRRQIGWTLED